MLALAAAYGRAPVGRQSLDVLAIAEHAAALPVRDFTRDAEAREVRE
jgi:hypothetical protein